MITSSLGDSREFIRVNNDDYYRLLSAKIVLDVLNRSMSTVRACRANYNAKLKCNGRNEEDEDDEQACTPIELDSIEFSVSDANKKKSNCSNQAWEIDFSHRNGIKTAICGENASISRMNTKLNSANCLKTKKYFNKKRW